MNDYFKTFYHMLIHPYLALEHEHHLQHGEGPEYGQLFPEPMGLPLKILLAWPFQMLESFYSLLFLALGSYWAQSLFADVESSLGIKFPMLPLLGYIFFGIVFFPIQEWIEIKIWGWATWCGLQLVKGEAPAPREIGECLALSLSSHQFRAIPILGTLAAKWARFVLIGIVLVREFKLTFVQALFVLLLPIMFFGMMLALLIMGLVSLAMI